MAGALAVSSACLELLKSLVVVLFLPASWVGQHGKGPSLDCSCPQTLGGLQLGPVLLWLCLCSSHLPSWVPLPSPDYQVLLWVSRASAGRQPPGPASEVCSSQLGAITTFLVLFIQPVSDQFSHRTNCPGVLCGMGTYCRPCLDSWGGR